MTIWEAIVLGVLQGLTEFLPVSSSGHLELAHYLFDIHEPNNMAFTMAVHMATVLSTFVVFWREIWRIVAGVLKWRMNDETIFAINILISLIPIMFVGLMFQDAIESLFTSNLLLVGSMLIVTAALLLFASRAKRCELPLTPKRAFIIGVAQACAVLPGLSRSGSTISAGVIQGVRPEQVAKFSFLMVIIPIVGMNLLEAFKGELTQSLPTMTIVAGFVAAFVTGTLACRWMIDVVSKGRLGWFALYCVVVGLASIALYFS